MYRKILALAVLLSCLGIGEMVAAPPAAKKSPAKPVAKPAVVHSSQDAITLLNLGIKATEQGQNAQAEQYFKQAMAKMAPGDPNLLVPYDTLAKIYFKQGKYQEALPYAQKALPLIVKRFGAKSVEEAGGLYLIANLYQQMKNPAAEITYKAAVSIFELPQNAAGYSASYPATLQNLAIIFSQRQDVDNALVYFQKALTLKQQHQDGDTGSLLENIGICYQNQKKMDEAITFYQQAVSQYEKTGDKAALQSLQFRLSNLRPAAHSGQQTAQETNGYDGRYYKAGMKAFNEEKNYEEAARQFKLALEQVQQYHPKEERFLANLRSAFGKALYFSESDEDAEPYFEQSLAYWTKNAPENDSDVLDNHYMLALVQDRKSSYELAEKHLQYVLTRGDKSSDLYVSSLPKLADNLSHQGRFTEAKPLYEQALAIYQKQLSPEDPKIKSVQYQLALLEKMFRYQTQDKAQYFNYAVQGIRRWNDDNKIIYVRLNTGEGYKGWDNRYLKLAEKAFQEWQAVFNNRFSFQFTNDPEKSDVTFNWTDKPLSETDVNEQLGVYQLEHTRGFFLKSDIVIAIADSGKNRTDAEIYATTLHEIGHMLGLAHSSNLSDIMAEIVNYSLPPNGWPTLTARDKQTALYLYGEKPAISNPKGITVAEYRRFDNKVTDGIEAFKHGDYKRAYRIFEDARSEFADDPYINFYCGVSAFENRDYQEARNIFETLVMPASTQVFSVDSQLGLIYVELGHKYNKFGKKNKAVSKEFYSKGVHHLQNALASTSITSNQRDYLREKLKEGLQQRKPEPVYYYDDIRMPSRFNW